VPPPRWEIPQGLRVHSDGTWRVGDSQVIHPPTLRYLKSHLVEDGGAACVMDERGKMPIDVQGPPFEVMALVLDAAAGTASVVLDDGSKETVRDTSLRMNDETGQIECAVRDGRFQARLSRAAHQVLLEHVTEEDGAFFLQVGGRRIPLRT
jgi:hypothetical protein